MRKIIFAGICFCIFACKKEEIDPKPLEKQEIVNHYADLGFAMYSNAVAKSKDLKIAVDAFVTNPTQTGFDACKIAWQNARVPYAHTEAFRFYGGPIDNATNGREAYINAWPLDEAYIDYVSSNSLTGIINNPNTYPTINESTLSDLNQTSSETNLTTGYHAIEFLLWGQDLNLTGPGNRPYTDYIDGGTAKNQVRRRAFLVAVTNLLITDLQSVANEWDKSKPNNYRTTFTNPSELKNSLAKILIGMGKFTNGEMATQRISVAYQNADQEDEHDCFSDYTMTDIRNWQEGLKAIYTGTYLQSNGTSFSSYLKKYNPDIDKNMMEKFAKTDAVLTSITTTFDQAIMPSNTENSKILALISDLRDQSLAYTDIVSKLDVLNEFNGLNTEK